MKHSQGVQARGSTRPPCPCPDRLSPRPRVWLVYPYALAKPQLPKDPCTLTIGRRMPAAVSYQRHCRHDQHTFAHMSALRPIFSSIPRAALTRTRSTFDSQPKRHGGTVLRTPFPRYLPPLFDVLQARAANLCVIRSRSSVSLSGVPDSVCHKAVWVLSNSRSFCPLHSATAWKLWGITGKEV